MTVTTSDIAQAYTITVEQEDEYSVVLIATHPVHGELGWIELGSDEWYGRRIMEIAVHAPYRRQGIATALYLHAEKLGHRPAHSDHRTPSGDAWAAAVSGADNLPANLFH